MGVIKAAGAPVEWTSAPPSPQAAVHHTGRRTASGTCPAAERPTGCQSAGRASPCSPALENAQARWEPSRSRQRSWARQKVLHKTPDEAAHFLAACTTSRNLGTGLLEDISIGRFLLSRLKLLLLSFSFCLCSRLFIACWDSPPLSRRASICSNVRAS